MGINYDQVHVELIEAIDSLENTIFNTVGDESFEVVEQIIDFYKLKIDTSRMRQEIEQKTADNKSGQRFLEMIEIATNKIKAYREEAKTAYSKFRIDGRLEWNRVKHGPFMPFLLSTRTAENTIIGILRLIQINKGPQCPDWELATMALILGEQMNQIEDYRRQLILECGKKVKAGQRNGGLRRTLFKAKEIKWMKDKARELSLQESQRKNVVSKLMRAWSTEYPNRPILRQRKAEAIVDEVRKSRRTKKTSTKS